MRAGNDKLQSNLLEDPMKKLSLLLLVAALLTSCQPAATPVPTPMSAPVESLAGSVSELVGTWWFTSAPMFVEIKADGTYRVWDNYSGTQAEGNYTFDAGRVTWVTSQPSCVDQLATYETYMTRQGGKIIQLRLQVVGSDSCDARAENLRGIAKTYNP